MEKANMEKANMAKAEPVRMLKTDEILETLSYLRDNAQGLRNRIHSACERIGVQFDPREADIEAAPAYGSLPQIHERIGEVGHVLAEASEFMNELERYV
jgi:hypothetical protein